MSGAKHYHNRKGPICSKIRSLLISLTEEPSKYDEITPKIEYWIEYVLREDFSTVDELVEEVSYMAWDTSAGCFASVGQFLREFRDAPHRSEQARTFVTQMCSRVLRWFAIASAEDLDGSKGWVISVTASGEGPGFIRAASFVGYLVEWGLLSHDLVRRHLTKSLTNHCDRKGDASSPGATRANAIYQLFIAAGNTLLQGLLDIDDVQACFDMLETRSFNVAKPIKAFRDIHAEWLQQREEQGDPRETEEHQAGRATDIVAEEVSAEVKTPIAFIPQDLPTAAISIEIPTFLQDIESPPVFNDVDSSLDSFINIPSGTVSPTLSISTVSDLTPTELGEGIDGGEKQTTGRHDIFYFEDGNVEIACHGGDTVFRVHSTIVSFSSSELRGILSQPALLNAPTPEGRPRITVSDSAVDFSNLLKMIYTPGFPARHEVPEFSVFASLLRMTTKYGFSNVRDQLVKDLKGAYPTKWEDFKSAKVLGEDVFGAPKPHPNAVLNLFEAQNVRFAIPFAAYCVSVGGFKVLVSDENRTALSRRVLAGIVQGMHTLSTSVSNIARMVVYGEYLRVCPEKVCTLNVDIGSGKERAEALEKVYLAMVDKREGGPLSPPYLGHLCTKCGNRVAAIHAAWGSACWEKLAPLFGVSDCWDCL